MDKTYLDRIKLRRSIMSSDPTIVLAAEDEAGAPIREIYEFLLGIYLPTRFPRMFKLSSSKPGGDADQLHSLVTGEHFPTTLGPSMTAIQALRVLGGLIDEELMFLLPSTDGDSYTLKGFVTCFVNGFDASKKLNLKLRDIHGPVPMYMEKIGRSMDRFFDKIPVGRVVKRANASLHTAPWTWRRELANSCLVCIQWSINTGERLFVPSGNHLYEGDAAPEEEVDVTKAGPAPALSLLFRS